MFLSLRTVSTGYPSNIPLLQTTDLDAYKYFTQYENIVHFSKTHEIAIPTQTWAPYA